MTKLNQVVALEKGVKAKADRELTDAYHLIQKIPMLNGIARTYRPKAEDGDQYPAERTEVMTRAEGVMDSVASSLTRLFDVIATKETANCQAVADVVVDGTVLLDSVPVTYLLFLEKQLVHISTFVEKLPTLDPAESWSMSDAANAWQTVPRDTTKSKKVPKNWVKDPGNDKHPAQVEVYHEDILEGYWTTVKFSGAIPATRKEELAKRVTKLVEAVKCAREEANGLEITGEARVGDQVFGYLFA